MAEDYVQNKLMAKIHERMGSEDKARRFAALTISLLKSDLAGCDTGSVGQAILEVAALDLDPSPKLGHVYFNKRKIKNVDSVQLTIGYRGLLQLVYRTKNVKKVSANVYCENDPVWEYEEGLQPILKHQPLFGARGNVLAAYAVIHKLDGGYNFVVVPHTDLERARQASPAGKNNSGPWATDYHAMCRKTALRRLVDIEDLNPEATRAAIVDETYEAGETPLMDAELVSQEDTWVSKIQAAQTQAELQSLYDSIPAGMQSDTEIASALHEKADALNTQPQ